jgi:ABC-type multidrug transport system permease subunit
MLEAEKIGTQSEPTRQAFSHPLIELTLMRLREFIRQPEAVFWVFIFPILMACALGLAFRNTAPQKTAIAVDAATERAAEIAAKLSSAADLEATVMTAAQATQALRTGKVALVISGSATKYDFNFDPTRPESRIAKLSANDALQRALGRNDIAPTQDRAFNEPGARYIDFLVPGLLGLNLLGNSMWGLGFAIVMARTQKLLKRFAATPMRRWHFLLSFILSRLLFLFAEVLVILSFAYFAFGVKIHGSILAVLLIAILGSMSFSGLGLLVAARPRTIEGVSGLMNFVMLPMWLLSGTFFSAARFPDLLQPFVRALPLTAVNDALRAVINDGASLTAASTQIAILLIWGVVSFVIALKIFRWQ